ncbi:hypothetical protein LCM08_06175 [Salipiger pacificus]|nr:hypothetical protein [Alloyangia pacifica]
MRQIGMDIGPIPYDRIVWYAERHALSDQFVETMEIADRLFLAGRADKEEAGKENGDP